MRKRPLPVYPLLFGTLLILLALVILAAFRLDGIFAWTIGLLYISYDSVLFMLVVFTVWGVGRIRPRELAQAPVDDSHPPPSMAVVIPARNERAILPACLAALAAQTDPPDEILIVDDGSTDDTVAWLKSAYDVSFDKNRGMSRSHPRLCVLLNNLSGKAHSLNLGWRQARSDIVVTLDADTFPEPDALANVRWAFMDNPALAAGGGVLVPRCGKSIFGGTFEFYQVFEYIRSFLERIAWMNYGMLVLVSGAFAAFRRDVLEKLNGFNTESRVEDYELIYRLYRHSHEKNMGYQVHVLQGVRAETDAPGNPVKFIQQRTRWFAGFLDTLFRNKDMIGLPEYGRFGRFMLPIKLIDTLKPVYGLLALMILAAFILTGGFRLYLVILYILLGKVVFDLLFHWMAFFLYHRWQNRPATPGFWLKSIAASLTEPFAFQILRQTAAVIGWTAFLSGRIAWQPQRPVRRGL